MTARIHTKTLQFYRLHRIGGTSAPLSPPKPIHSTTPACRDGRKTGVLEGKAFGLQKGFEIGHELGFFSGSIQIWKQINEKQPGFINDRAAKTILAMETTLQEFPMNKPKDDTLQEKLDALRGRFKVAIAQLSLQDVYDAHSSRSSQHEGSGSTIMEESLQF